MSSIAPLNPVQRAVVTEATANKYRGLPLSFAEQITCLHMLRDHMVAFGYSPPTIPAFKDAKGARKALRSTGHRTIKGLLTEVLGKPVPAAQMRVGDVALGPGIPFEAVGLYAGNGKFLGWHDDGRLGLVNIAIDQSALIGAWRLI
jgi:hypothetical protein